MPIVNLAASDMRALVQGGSKVSSSLTPVTPGTARAARSTSAGRLPVHRTVGRGQEVMRISDLSGVVHVQAVDQAKLVDVDGHFRIVRLS